MYSFDTLGFTKVYRLQAASDEGSLPQVYPHYKVRSKIFVLRTWLLEIPFVESRSIAATGANCRIQVRRLSRAQVSKYCRNPLFLKDIRTPGRGDESVTENDKRPVSIHDFHNARTAVAERGNARQTFSVSHSPPERRVSRYRWCPIFQHQQALH